MYQNSNMEEILRMLKKRRNLYTLLFVIALIAGGVVGAIPAVGWYISTALVVLAGIFAGLGMLCINCYRYNESGGRKQGGGLWWILLLIFGLIVIPIITVFIVGKIRPLEELLLGVKFE